MIQKPTKIYLTHNDKYFLAYEDASIEHAEIGQDPKDIEEFDLYGLKTHNEKLAKAAIEFSAIESVASGYNLEEHVDYTLKLFLQSPEYKALVGEV